MCVILLSRQDIAIYSMSYRLVHESEARVDLSTANRINVSNLSRQQHFNHNTPIGAYCLLEPYRQIHKIHHIYVYERVNTETITYLLGRSIPRYSDSQIQSQLSVVFIFKCFVGLQSIIIYNVADEYHQSRCFINLLLSDNKLKNQNYSAQKFSTYKLWLLQLNG